MIPAEIRFTQGTTDIGTANFILAVEKTPHADGTTDGTQETMANLETRLQAEIDGLDDRIEALENAEESGLTQQEKNLILTLFSKAAYAEDDASTAYDALEALWTVATKTVTYSLSHVTSSNTATSVESGQRYTTTLTATESYSINSVTVTMGGVDVTATYYNSGTITIPSVTGNIVITASAVLEVSSLSAVYTQSGTVYDTDSLDSLKSDLVVTATYPDSSTAVIDSADYNLSGTLAEGTSTVTVAYDGKTATFNVTVSHLSITAINLPYGAYIDTEYVPTAFNLKYLIGVQYLNADYDYTQTSRPFAGVNRLPASTTATEVYWHVYFMNGTGNNTPQNSQAIQYGYNAYKNPDHYIIQLRTANGDTSANVSNLTTTPFYFFVADGESKIRANEDLDESLVTGTFAITNGAYSLTATTAEAPIDSFWIGKVNQCGSRTIAEFEGGVKIFCFKVWDENDNLLVNMHPAMSGSAIGMYDSVRNKFCEAQGTGAYLS